jgi:hypothetical protein
MQQKLNLTKINTSPPPEIPPQILIAKSGSLPASSWTRLPPQMVIIRLTASNAGGAVMFLFIIGASGPSPPWFGFTGGAILQQALLGLASQEAQFSGDLSWVYQLCLASQ